MGQPDSWLTLGFLGALVLVPVLCAGLAVVKSTRGTLAQAPPAHKGGRLGRVFGRDLEDDGETLADRIRHLRRDGRSIEAELLVCTETGMTQAEAHQFVSALG
jgi:hypothetical protein